jgi:hypothetical protein
MVENQGGVVVVGVAIPLGGGRAPRWRVVTGPPNPDYIPVRFSHFSFQDHIFSVERQL